MIVRLPDWLSLSALEDYRVHERAWQLASLPICPKWRVPVEQCWFLTLLEADAQLTQFQICRFDRKYRVPGECQHFEELARARLTRRGNHGGGGAGVVDHSRRDPRSIAGTAASLLWLSGNGNGGSVTITGGRGGTTSGKGGSIVIRGQGGAGP